MLVPLEPPSRDVRFSEEENPVWESWNQYKNEVEAANAELSDFVLNLNCYRKHVEYDPEAERTWATLEHTTIPAVVAIQKETAALDPLFRSLTSSSSTVSFALSEEDAKKGKKLLGEIAKRIKKILAKVATMRQKHDFPAFVKTIDKAIEGLTVSLTIQWDEFEKKLQKFDKYGQTLTAKDRNLFR